MGFPFPSSISESAFPGSGGTAYITSEYGTEVMSLPLFARSGIQSLQERNIQTLQERNKELEVRVEEARGERDHAYDSIREKKQSLTAAKARIAELEAESLRKDQEIHHLARDAALYNAIRKEIQHRMLFALDGSEHPTVPLELDTPDPNDGHWFWSLGN